MFSAGRYDPNLEISNKITNTNTDDDDDNDDDNDSREQIETLARKRKNQERDVSMKSTDSISEDCDEDDNNDDDDGDSSSCPSSSGDDSSSSAPSSDSEDDDDDTAPAFQVIAPEQKEHAIDIMSKRLKTSNEGIDDFDHDYQNQNQSIEQSEEVTRALQMSKLAIKDAAKIWGLAPFLVEKLESDEYDSFFPIQALVIPDVIASERHAHIRNRDVCVSSPTGSGKTLAFVIPVLNSLAGRKIRRLRALVVLPSRDLATQVYNVFEQYAQGSDLKIGLAIGQNDFENEQRSLIIGTNSLTSKNYHSIQHALQPFSINNALRAFGNGETTNDKSTTCTWAQTNLKRLPDLSVPRGGSSSVDVLVCTPGRLIDHLDKTPGFTLQHLRFLVIDEADRLVNQSYQNWIQRVVNAASAGPEEIRADLGKSSKCHNVSPIHKLDPVTWRREEGNTDSQTSGFLDLSNCMDVSVCRPMQLRKLLFSATLTKDPKKLTSLGLVNPKQFDAHQLNMNHRGERSVGLNPTDILSYSLPRSLSECMVECTAEQKPLVLLAVLLEQGLVDKESNINDGIVVVFTSSKDSTHRLARLLQLLWAAAGYGSTKSVAEFSSALNQKQRAKLMKRCNLNAEEERVQIIVCSDGMSRGMDIQSVSAVINYDVPSYAKTYVHRCGRTARAGRKGRAITMLKDGQVSKFIKMRQLIGNPEMVTKIGIKKDLVKKAIPVYQKCIRALQNVMNAESDNTLGPVSSLGPEWLM